MCASKTLWLIHTDHQRPQYRDGLLTYYIHIGTHEHCTERDRDREREMMGFSIMLCTVHTTQGQGQAQRTIVFCCAHPGTCPCQGPVKCV